MERMNVIDLSDHNVSAGKINWQAVKASGVQGVMLRAGWAGYAGELHRDTNADAGIDAAHAAGLDVGLYVYTYANTVEAAKRAARETAALALEHCGKITYPIAYDVEETQNTCLTALGKRVLTDTVIGFCDELKRLNCYPMYYTYRCFAAANLETERLAQYDLWAAQYPVPLTESCPWRIPHGMWQYIGIGGRCDGVTGDCDRSYAYKDYPALIRKAELNGLKTPQQSI